MMMMIMTDHEEDRRYRASFFVFYQNDQNQNVDSDYDDEDDSDCIGFVYLTDKEAIC